MSDWKQQLVVQLETVTPLFLGGADPRGEPELRPPAFRGAMRGISGRRWGGWVPGDEGHSVVVHSSGRPGGSPREGLRMISGSSWT